MNSERISRRFLTIAAWWAFCMFAFMFISLAIPGLAEMLASPTPGSVRYVTIKMLTAATGIVLIGGWFATIWHAAVNPNFSAGQRAAVIAMIVVGSAISPFVYYFGYLRWTSHRVDSTAAA